MGKVIIFEGLDCSGKDTQINTLKTTLINQAKSVLVVDTLNIKQWPLAEIIRNKLSGINESNPKELLALFIAQLHNVHRFIRDNISNYDYILVNRYIYSTIAYAQNIVNDLSYVIIKSLGPSINFKQEGIDAKIVFLDIPVDVSVSRLANNRDKTDIIETEEKLKQVYNNYKNYFYVLGVDIYKINATYSVKKISAEIADAVINNNEKYLYAY